jgi:hypothetical protein
MIWLVEVRWMFCRYEVRLGLPREWTTYQKQSILSRYSIGLLTRSRTCGKRNNGGWEYLLVQTIDQNVHQHWVCISGGPKSGSEFVGEQFASYGGGGLNTGTNGRNLPVRMNRMNIGWVR